MKKLCLFFILFLGSGTILGFTRDLGFSYVSGTGPKVLHLSFHRGCIKDFEAVARELSLDLTSWYILHPRDRSFFDEKSPGNSIYNIGHDRAERVWKKHKNYFEQFDVIITSDTAPLSRIFLQNNAKVPVIIWICNRFDYFDGQSLDCRFPDQEYYDLFKRAVNQKKVKIVSYTPYEYVHARGRGIDIGTYTIKPLGTVDEWNDHKESFIPATVKKEETFFLPPRFGNQQQLDHVIKSCNDRGINVFCGRYNGPNDLKGFKGIIHFPYAWSNLALFENIQNGFVHFVPTQRFIREMIAQHLPVHYFSLANLEYSEWYCKENEILFVYFDSWDDLKHKIETTDFESSSAKIKEFARQHRATMLQRWQERFDELLNLN